MDTHEADFINCNSNSRYGTWRHVWVIWGEGAFISTIPVKPIKLRNIPLCGIYSKSYLPQPLHSKNLSVPAPRESLRKAKGIWYYQCAGLSDMNSFVFLKMTYQHEQSWLAQVWIVLQIPFLSSPELKNVLSPSLFPLFVCVFFNVLPIEVTFWVRIPVKTHGIHTAQLRLSGGRCVG